MNINKHGNRVMIREGNIDFFIIIGLEFFIKKDIVNPEGRKVAPESASNQAIPGFFETVLHAPAQYLIGIG